MDESKGNIDNIIIMRTGIAFQILYVPVFEASSDKEGCGIVASYTGLYAVVWPKNFKTHGATKCISKREFSVADPGCSSPILIFFPSRIQDLGSRIHEQHQKRRGKY